MARKAKIKLGLQRQTVEERAALLNRIIQKMSGNPDFPNASMMLQDVIAARDAMITAETKRDTARMTASEGNELLQQKVEAFDEEVKKLSRAVTDVAKGDAAKMEGAGFYTYFPGVRQTPGHMRKVMRVEMLSGYGEGKLALRWEPVKGAKVYRIELSTDPTDAGSWIPVALPTASRYVLTGLDSGTRYYVRVSATGTSGNGPWSDQVAKIAP